MSMMVSTVDRLELRCPALPLLPLSHIVQIKAILRAQYLQVEEGKLDGKRFLFMFRDPADLLWAVWNFWFVDGLDSGVPGKHRIGYRFLSPLLY
jgi:hypothetical protein